jgi:hypothetical protein
MAALAAADTRPRSASGVRVMSRVEAHTFAYPFPVPPSTDSGTSIQTAGTTANGARAAQVTPAPAIVAQIWARSVLSRPAPSDPATIPAIHAAPATPYHDEGGRVDDQGQTGAERSGKQAADGRRAHRDKGVQ